MSDERKLWGYNYAREQGASPGEAESFSSWFAYTWPNDSEYTAWRGWRRAHDAEWRDASAALAHNETEWAEQNITIIKDMK